MLLQIGKVISLVCVWGAQERFSFTRNGFKFLTHLERKTSQFEIVFKGTVSRVAHARLSASHAGSRSNFPPLQVWIPASITIKSELGADLLSSPTLSLLSKLIERKKLRQYGGLQSKP